MKLVMFEASGQSEPVPGLLTDRGVVGLAGVIERGYIPQMTMQNLIDGFDRLRPTLEKLAAEGEALPLASVRLRPPLPRPGKILCCIANYWEHAQREARPLNMFLKNPEAVVGPGDTIRLPEFTEPWIFMHEAELALVIKGPAKKISQANWRSAVFGYTGLIDVSARGEGRRTWKAGSWLGKSFDTFAPIGPCITTADEIPEPNDVVVRFWNDGQLRHNYNTDDMEHRVPELVEFASTVMTLNTGDLIACGTNHEGLGALQDGETVEIEVQHVGRMSLKVVDPLKRQWERGIYMGANSTNPEAVKRHRPQGANVKGSAMTDIDIRKIVTSARSDLLRTRRGRRRGRSCARSGWRLSAIRSPAVGSLICGSCSKRAPRLANGSCPSWSSCSTGRRFPTARAPWSASTARWSMAALAVIRCSGGRCAPRSAAARRSSARTSRSLRRAPSSMCRSGTRTIPGRSSISTRSRCHWPTHRGRPRSWW